MVTVEVGNVDIVAMATNSNIQICFSSYTNVTVSTGVTTKVVDMNLCISMIKWCKIHNDS